VPTERPPTCAGCPANATARGWVPPTGPLTARMVLVGQGPGADEAAVGEPFVGPSGSTLDRWLVRAGVPRERLAIGNVVQCQLPGNRPPHKAEARHCWRAHVRPWLESLTAARVVVPVGVPAMEALLGDSATASVAGTVHPVAGGWPAEPFPQPAQPPPAADRLLAPILHPAHIIRGQWAAEPAQVRFLRRAWELANNPAASLPGALMDVRNPPPGASPTPTLEELREFVTSTRALDDRRMACDIEGTQGQLIGVGFSRLADERTIYIPLLDTDAPYWHNEELAEVDCHLRELLAYPLIMHNGQAFDVPFLESVGYEVPQYIDDTMIRHHILYAEMEKSLESLAILYCGFPSWKWLSKVGEQGDAK